jgi:predicted signal transduction protein with EAL and GGDEF domain
MPQTDLAGASAFAERLRETITQGAPLTVSVGVAAADDTDTAESLFHRADAALYRAKSDGRNLTRCHNGQVIEAAATDVSLHVPVTSEVINSMLPEADDGVCQTEPCLAT